MMPVLQIGPAAIRLPGLLILGGVWIGSLTLDAEARRNGLSPDRLSKLVFFSILVGLLSARLGYVLEHLAAYAPDPGGVFSLSPYTLSLPEGVAGGLIFAWIYGRRQNLPFWETADAVTPMVAVIGVFLALAHLASGDAFGAPQPGV
jgi:phosphatidylglycerol:prolipoprotein diacylglycerol transferase